jgi:hypothetical protein
MSCAAYWLVDSQQVGRCRYYRAGQPCEHNAGRRCPFNGQRDFGLELRKWENTRWGRELDLRGGDSLAEL